MSAKPRILVDANVALDVLAKTEPHYTTSAAVWALAEQGTVKGLLAAHTVSTLHYLLTWALGQKINRRVRKARRVFSAFFSQRSLRFLR